MAYDALSLSVLRQELETALIGGKITKIYQPEKDEIILYVFNGKTYKLLISANASVNRIHLTQMPTDNPKICPAFCMLLRKRITNAVITEINQLPYERVLDFALNVTDELGYKKDMRLIFELTGKTSNIILTDANYVICDSAKHLPQDINGKRIILNGAKYEFFPPQNKIKPFDIPRIREFLSECTLPLRKTLPEILLGVSQATVNEIMFGIDENDHSLVNNALIAERIAQYGENLKNKKPCVVTANGAPIDAYPFDYRSVKGERIFYDTLNEAHDNYYYLTDKIQRFNGKAKSVSTIVKNAVSRTEKKLAIQRQSILEAENRETFKQYGDLILSNLHAIGKNDSALVCYNYYDNSTAEIPLDTTLSPQQNAQAYYKKYRKLKSSAEHNSKLVEENEKLLDYLYTIKESLKHSSEADDLQQIKDELQSIGLIREKKQTKKPSETTAKPLRYEIDGYSVFVGKNNFQNNHVTFKMSKPDDVWLHTQKIHSSHVLIVKGAQDTVPDKVIVKAAEICAYFSQGNASGKVAVDYTEKINVKKPPRAPLGYVIYPTYKTIIVEPNRHTELLTNG